MSFREPVHTSVALSDGMNRRNPSSVRVTARCSTRTESLLPDPRRVRCRNSKRKFEAGILYVKGFLAIDAELPFRCQGSPLIVKKTVRNLK